jgi:hypothetical protein
MAIEKFVEKGNEALILSDCKTRNGRCFWNTEFFTIEENTNDSGIRSLTFG